MFNGFLKIIQLDLVSSNQWNSQCSLKRMELSCGHNITNLDYVFWSLACHCQSFFQATSVASERIFNVHKLVYDDRRKSLGVETGSGLVIAHDFLVRRKKPAEFRLCPQCPAPQSSVDQPTYKINCAKHNAKWDICGQILQFWGNKCCLFSVVLYVRLLGPIYVHLRALLEICILSRIDFTHFFVGWY